MTEQDIVAVRAIDEVSFPRPWPVPVYEDELAKEPGRAIWLVARLPAGSGEVSRWAVDGVVDGVVGYAGLWVIADEGHVCTLAVHPRARGLGIARRLLAALLEAAMAAGCSHATLEVRESNTVALGLYRTFGFLEEGRRARYYSDNGEDALILTTPRFDDPVWKARYWPPREVSAWR
jgi:ribosomal-protein-alanine N-acetyltransferase